MNSSVMIAETPISLSIAGLQTLRPFVSAAATTARTHVPRPQENFVAALGTRFQNRLNARQHGDGRNLRGICALRAYNDKRLPGFQVGKHKRRSALQHLIEIPRRTAGHSAGTVGTATLPALPTALTTLALLPALSTLTTLSALTALLASALTAGGC